jgi:hypothetical protein
MAVMLWLATHAPGAPYNVRELLRPGLGLATVVLLATALGLIGLFGTLAERWVSGRPPAAALWRWPTLLLGVALTGAALVMLAVPEEAVWDVVGSPVLGWPGPLELWLRLAVLAGLVAWLLFGGQLAWRAPGGRGARWVAWALIACAVLPLGYWVVVSEAATDNLTELMADDASPLAAAALAGAVWWAGCVGGALAWLVLGSRGSVVRGAEPPGKLPRAGRGESRADAAGPPAHAAAGRWGWGLRLAATVLVLAAGVLVGYALVQAGTEAMLVKYGRAFSALQFLLGTDRAHPPGPAALLARFALVWSALLVYAAWSAWPLVGARTSR